VSNFDDRNAARKERAKEQRKAAYQAAKERWKNDPRRLVMKEAAKQQRKKVAEAAKERRKVATTQAKAQRKEEHAVKVAEKRAEAAKDLWELVTWVSKGSSANN
jgi:5,10-methenyltetrahydromethanopterin hydrogenase